MKNPFRPDLACCGIADIDIDQLAQSGIRCALLDLDNTLAPWDDRVVTEVCQRFIDGLREAGIRPIIISNNQPERVRDFAESLNVDFEGKARKPLPFGFWRVLKRFGLQKKECVMVGDQIMTDILGGNLAGLTTLLVNPFCDVEWGGTKYNRMMERWVMRLFKIERAKEEKS